MNIRDAALVALASGLLPSANAAVLENATVRAETTGSVVRLSVRDESGWRPVLESSPEARGINTLATAPSGTGQSITWTGRQGDALVDTVLTLGAKPGHVRVVSRVRFAERTPVESITGRWRFLPGAPDATWTPHLTPDPNHVIGQHAFRSPATIAQKGRLAALLMPDVDCLARNPEALPAAMNMDVKEEGGPWLQMALMPHQVERHVFWRHDPGHAVEVGPGEATLAYDILLTSDAEPRRAYRLAARWWWEEQGTMHLLRDTLPQATPWKRYLEVGYDDYLPLIWRETEMNGETVGGAAMPVLASRNATWFQCWFNDLRSAYGAYLWGKWTNRPGIVEKARKTRQLLLNAPQVNGLFPVIYDWDRQRWIGSSGPGVGGGEDIYHPVDCAWAAYWLLMWHLDLEAHPDSVAFAKRLGDGLIRIQKPSGEIPSYLRMDTLQPTDRLKESAETAGGGMFLALLARTTGEAKYMRAARQAAEYVRREIMPTNKWYDYETFYSCSGKPEGFYDTRTDQHPQNNLSIHWAAEMFRQLYLADQRPEDLADGEALMDYLNLYQQAWAPKFLTFEAFGGFGVQNTDAEWNDARQAQFACTNLDFYRLTGKPEYMERGIAALRAGFATTYMPENGFISPYSYSRTPLGHADENYGHGGVDGPAGPTSWDWGTGSALTAVAYARRAFGDVWVDGDLGVAFGINGVTATLRGDDLQLRSSVQGIAPILVRGDGRDLPASLVVNGERRSLKPIAWRDGFLVTPVADPRIRHRAPDVLPMDNTAITFEVWPYDTTTASVTVGGRRVDATRNGATGIWSATLPVADHGPGRRDLEYTITATGPDGPVSTEYRTQTVALGRETALWSESFTGADVPERWSVEVPVDGPVVRAGANGITLAVPGDRSYDQWVPQNDAPRALTPVPEGEWSFTARFDTSKAPRRGLYHAGIVLQMGDNDFAFYGPKEGAGVMLERSGRNALGTSPFTGPFPVDIELRARYAGDVLWFDSRPAGGTWSAPIPLPGVARRAGFLVKTWEAIPAEITVKEARMATLGASRD